MNGYASGKLEKGEEIELGNLSLQPCGLTNPARQSLASSRKRVLRGGGRPPLRSVDSESQCRAIEPRNLCSREPPLLTQAGAVPMRRTGLAYFGPTGVQEQGAGTRGSIGNLRDPAVSVVTAGLESRLTNSRLIYSSSRAGGDEQGTNDGIAKRRKRSAAR